MLPLSGKREALGIHQHDQRLYPWNFTPHRDAHKEEEQKLGLTLEIQSRLY